MFEHLSPADSDAILALSLVFRDDPRPEKIDLGVGVYRDERGRTPVMRAVREAERRLFEAQETKAYVGLVGADAFNAAMTTLVFGDDCERERIRAVQTPGGAGALRILADLLRRARPDATVWLSEPTWANHGPIVDAAGFRARPYPYLDPDTRGVRVEAMLAALEGAQAGDVVLLHACCHNPTGADLQPEHWHEVGRVAARRGLVPFVDFAYQGFGAGVEADAAGIRVLAAAVEDMVVASSCSKNFGLYRDRVGCALLVGGSAARADLALGQVLNITRATYSMPPDHGAATVGIILEDDALRAAWRDELELMRTRMVALRAEAAATLRVKSNSDAFDYIARHRGMFSLIGTTVEQVTRLREEFAVYLVGSGRMNVAGFAAGQIEPFADALLAVTRP